MNQENRASMILCSNYIFTGEKELLSGFVAIKDNKIIGIGKPEEIDCFTNSETNIYHYNDSLILPGFHDCHVHLLIGSLMENGADLRDAKSEKEAVKLLHDSYKDRKESMWIIGGAWDHFKWEKQQLPTKTSLDTLFPDKPVFLLNRECHGAWLNSKALNYFNIDRNTPNPDHGEIFKDEKGEPTGYLHENAALMVIPYVFDVSDIKHMELTKGFIRKALSLGITSVADVQAYDIMKYKAYEELERSNELNIRMHFSPSITEDIEKLKYLKKAYNSNKLKFSGAKGFIDGTPMGYSGLMVEPYFDKPHIKGSTAIDPDDLKQLVIKLDAEDIRVRLHACGDGAVRLGLDVIETAKRLNGNRDIRHTIEHIECIHKDDLKRFKELGVIASVQPEHLPKYSFYDHPFHAALGPERIKYAWAFNSLLKNGAILSFGTDYPIVEMNPLKGIYRAVSRLTNDKEPEGGFSPQEKLTIYDAVKAYTYGSAYANNREDELGTLEVGKLADIIVLDKNIFQCHTEEILDAKVVLTIMDGNRVYEPEY